MDEWIITKPGFSYFFTESGKPWTPIGQNDAINWPDLINAFKRKDIKSVENYFYYLNIHGVNCIRIMLEYCQNNRFYLEKPAGNFLPNMVQFWDDIICLGIKYSIRFLITPFDTFWMWRRWKFHPYNSINGGPCIKRNNWLTCKNNRNFIKNRMEFATKRWGRTGVIFGWDLWNEINPSHAGNKSELMNDFVEDLGIYIKKIEIELFGKAHLQTVSIYGHQMIQHDHVSTMLFRNPVLDFASTHFYEKGTIDNPKNTIDPAFACGKLVEEALHEITDNRPFLDTEHGPIYKYKKNNKGLARKFDEEYFHNFQWAHFASGGCGGGMRWPYRQPHQLTLPMRNSQHSLAEFAKIIRWDIKNRFNYNSKINIKPSTYYTFCFGDNNHFVLWILRNNFIDKQGVLICKEIESVEVELPWITFGYYRVILWNTRLSYIVQILEIEAKESGLKIIISSVDRDIVLYGGLMSTTINQ